MKQREIPLFGPNVSSLEEGLVKKALREGFAKEKTYYFQEVLERNFSERLGRKYALAVSSGTAALHLALASIDIGPGDEVLVSDLTWSASAAPICYLGARPVFCDIDPVDLCISAESILQNITSKTKAIIAVDLYGALPKMKEITEICQVKGLVLIEDAAQSLGSKLNENWAGQFGQISVFSFNGSKILTTGEGGMLCTDEEGLCQRIYSLRNHGRSHGADPMVSEEVGYKYVMGALQAALGIGQLKRLDEILIKKKQIYLWYKKYINSKGTFKLLNYPQTIDCNAWLNNILLTKKNASKRDQLIDKMASVGIQCRPFFYPLSSLPAFMKYANNKQYFDINKNSYEMSSLGVSLPSGYSLEENDICYICESLNESI